MYQLLYNCAHFTCQQGNAQTPSSQASAVCELSVQMYKLGLEKAEEPEIKLPTSVGSQRKQGDSRKISTSASLTMPQPLTVWITTNCGEFLKEMGIPDHLTCLLRNLYEGQEATVRTGHGTLGWFKTGKGVGQGCKLTPCLFNVYAENIMQNARLGESQAGIKTVWRNSKASDIQVISHSWQKVKRN